MNLCYHYKTIIFVSPNPSPLLFHHTQCRHTARSYASTVSLLSFQVSNTVLFVFDSRRFEGTCSIHLQHLKMKAIVLFETLEIYDPVTQCNTPEKFDVILTVHRR